LRTRFGTWRLQVFDVANIAEICVALGEKGAAFEALEQSYNDRSQPLGLIWSILEFRPLHAEARYQARRGRFRESVFAISEALVAHRGGASLRLRAALQRGRPSAGTSSSSRNPSSRSAQIPG
jgi:hypothetical protein